MALANITLAHAQEVIGQHITRVDNYDELKADFLVAARQDPVSAIEWKSAGLAAAQELRYQVVNLKIQMDQVLNVEGLDVVIRRALKKANRDLANSVRNGQSTSQAANLISSNRQIGIVNYIKLLDVLEQSLTAI